jgi:hypothetical protein
VFDDEPGDEQGVADGGADDCSSARLVAAMRPFGVEVIGPPMGGH